MWNVKQTPLSDLRIIHFLVQNNSCELCFADVLKLWRESPKFGLWFNQRMSELPFSAFRWETPPVTTSSVTRPFEFVVIESPTLARPADRSAFAAHFRDALPESVVCFSNLGGDARLVVPCPPRSSVDYCHLADFVRGAPEAQIQDFWKTVGTAMRDRLDQQPVWLNTAGAGVAWLHVRLDDRPKYYRYQPYLMNSLVE